jgi:hypothetical protein
VARRLLYYALKVFRLDVAILVLVEIQESLPHTLALQTAQHLRELWVGHRMSLVLCANVQCRPLAIPVERQAILALVCFPYIIEVVEVDDAGPILVEEAEDDFVLGVRFRKQVLEDAPVLEGDAPLPVAVGDLEEDAILVSPDLVLLRNAWSVLRSS